MNRGRFFPTRQTRSPGGRAVRTITLIVAVSVLGCSARPPAPPAGVLATQPFGAIDVDELHFEFHSGLEGSIEESFLTEPPLEFDRDRDGVRSYAILALSGGGSNGAFGAGVLSGWTASGDRPDFKVVTGVSTGALQATFAFLGPDYDDELREVYTQFDTDSIYRKRWLLSALFSDSTSDTWPLKELLDQYITREILEGVARRHRAGHRLFVGTTNLDTTEFIIWDMGRIAASGRPDSLEHYRRVLLASASIPVLFPPVYFQVSSGIETYYEMHVDGGAYAQAFLRGFMLDFEDAMEIAAVNRSNVEMKLYVIRNGKADERDLRDPVRGRATSIAAKSIETQFKLSVTSALYRLYVLSNRNGIEFNLATIPQDYVLEFKPTEFDRAGMEKLFEYGRQRALERDIWLKAPQFLDSDELF